MTPFTHNLQLELIIATVTAYLLNRLKKLLKLQYVTYNFFFFFYIC